MTERWVVAGKTDEMRFEPGAAVRIEDHWVGIFRLGTDYFAIDNACPHAGAPLCDGTGVVGIAHHKPAYRQHAMAARLPAGEN